MCLPIRHFTGTGASTIPRSTFPSTLLLTCPYKFNMFSVFFFVTGATFIYPLTCLFLMNFLRDSTQPSQNVKCRKAAGPDNIPPWMVKNYAHLLAATVTAIFNSSLREGKLPDLWKTATIVPVPRNIHPAHWKTTSGRFHLRQYWRKYLKELC